MEIPHRSDRTHVADGISAEESSIRDNRATADLKNIANIYAPVIPELSTAGLIFLRNATHSGMIDNWSATFLGAYAIDQIDVTDRLKVRLSVRQDGWDEQLNPRTYVAGRNTEQNTPLEPGFVQTRIDTPLSWSAGALYTSVSRHCAVRRCVEELFDQLQL